MKNFKYSMEKSFENMVKEIDEVLNLNNYSDEERSRLFYSCGSCLHCIMDVAERINFLNEDRGYISAFRFANNMLKHDKELFEITISTGGMTFPMVFPLTIEKREIRWKKLIDNGKYPNQYLNYEKYLKGNPVKDTCRKAIDIMNKYLE